jgi:hypothetical protein
MLLRMTDGPDPLDDRIMKLTENLPETQREAIRSPLAYIRETWRGAEYHRDLDRALEVIEENAAQIRWLIEQLGLVE